MKKNLPKINRPDFDTWYKSKKITESYILIYKVLAKLIKKKKSVLIYTLLSLFSHNPKNKNSYMGISLSTIGKTIGKVLTNKRNKIDQPIRIQDLRHLKVFQIQL